MSTERKKVYEALRWASSYLTAHGYEEPIGEILLKHFLHVDRTKFFQMLREELPREKYAHFQNAIKEVCKGVPVQHITGVETFFGRQYIVNEHVLIPRPETEELIVALLKNVEDTFGNQPLTVVDVGTGSGAIAITLALESQSFNVTTIDISEQALKVAQQNANKLGANLQLLHGDLLEPIIQSGTKVDVVVSNPPYISETDFASLADNVRIYEPTLALVGGPTGYEHYERLIVQLPKVLKETAIVAFEVGAGQSSTVAQLLKKEFSNAKVKCINDINGKDRIVIAEISS